MGFFSDLFKGKKKYYSYNNPDFSYFQGYTPTGGLESLFNPNAQDWMGYGQYQGFNKMPAGLELLFQDRDIIDTDYRVMDPLSQQWQQFEEQSQLRDYLSQNASGQWGTDLAGMDDAALSDYMTKQGWMKEAYDYGDPYQRSLYYTPYNVALGAETGNIPGMTATGKTKNQNWASLHPNVDYNFWNNSTLANLGTLPGLEGFNLEAMNGISNWQDPSVSNWNQGFISETNPWGSGIDADYTGGKGSYRSGGIGGILGSVLSFIPGLQPLGWAMSFANAAVNKNPLGMFTSFLPMIPALQGIGSQAGMLAGQEAGLSTLGWGGATTGLQGALNLAGVGGLTSGLMNASPYLTNPVMGGLTSALGGGDFMKGAVGGLVGTGINEYVSPVFKSALQDMGLNTDIATGLTNLASSYGTNAATSYLSTLGDSDSYSDSTSRLVSNTTPYPSSQSFTEGLSSGFGLPQWMQPQTQAQQPQQQSRGRMTNNQLGGTFDPEKTTEYMVG